MALINCPECGKQVSDRATSCPNCSFPIKGYNTIKFKTQISNLPPNVGGLIKKVYIYNTQTNQCLWQGIRGDVAEIFSEVPISIEVRYKGLSAKAAQGLRKTVEPGKKYGVIFTPGTFFNARYTLVEIDVIDLD